MNLFFNRYVRALPSTLRIFLVFVGLLACVSLIFFLFPQRGFAPTKEILTSPMPEPAEPTKGINVSPAEPILPRTPQTAATTSSATRIANPYPFPPLSREIATQITRAALVNIFCTSNNPTLRSISGSGVFIDPRGVILTNAHVAQYVLLSSRYDLGIVCVIRSGSPARALTTATTLYISPSWVMEHARNIGVNAPTTGEHDYALLLITQPSNLPALPPLPYIPIDTRDAIAFPGDEVVIASYPAEFLGSINAQFNLHPMSSVASVARLHTFHVKSADVLSFQGVVEAQSGSSGGPIVNMWGQLVGLISARSAGYTAPDRDLRALSLSYINRDLGAETGSTLAQLLSKDVAAYALDFNLRIAPKLTPLYGPVISD